MIKQVSVDEYARSYSLVNNLWLFLGFGNDGVIPIIAGVVGEKYLLICNLYIGSCYHRRQLQQPPQALMYLFTFNGNLSHLAFFF